MTVHYNSIEPGAGSAEPGRRGDADTPGQGPVSGSGGPGFSRLLAGEAPGRGSILEETTTGLEALTDFLAARYLEEYIPQGGSKIKFVTGRSGSGKTHFLQRMQEEASGRKYVIVSFSARDIWLHDFREIYLEILRQCDIEHILQGCADQIIRELDQDPAEIGFRQDGSRKSFMDFLSERGEADPISRGAIRSALRANFTRNSRLDNNFACCCSILTGGILGHPVLEPASRDLLLAFLHGDKSVKLSQLRALGLSPSRITKYNARHLLRSLSEVVHMAGYAGLLITIDDLEILMNRAAGSAMRYTKLRRNDAYESIRQLIDDIDNMRYVFFFFSFDRELMDNENVGFKTYQALWMRIQNEVVSTRFNRFADIIDLDRYADSFYTEDVILEMSRKLAKVLQQNGIPASTLMPEAVEELMERAQFGGIGIPYMVNRAVLEAGKTDQITSGGPDYE